MRAEEKLFIHYGVGDKLVSTISAFPFVIPAQAGIQRQQTRLAIPQTRRRQ